MMPFFVFIVIFLYALFFPSRTHAIIVLPAVILIPIAKIVALIIGGLSFPLISLGVFIHTFTKNYKLALLISLSILIFAAIVSAVILKQKFPDNPLF